MVTCHEDEKQTEKTMLFTEMKQREEEWRRLFSAGLYDFLLSQYNVCCFWRGSGVVQFFLFANERESRTYDSVYNLRRENPTKNTLNIMLFGENVLVPLYLCMLSFAEIQHLLYFQNIILVLMPKDLRDHLVGGTQSLKILSHDFSCFWNTIQGAFYRILECILFYFNAF